MSYFTVFVAAVPTKDKDAYIAHSAEAAKIFKRHGAVSYVECWGSDVPDGEVTSFPMAVKCEPDETVIFGFARWASKAACDTAMPKVMAEMTTAMKSGDLGPPPLDGKRMIFGSFDAVVEL